MNYSVQHQAVPTASARLQPCAQVTASARAAICRDWLTLQHKNGSVDFTLFSHRGWAEGMVPAPLQLGLKKGTTQRTQRIRLRESSTAASKVALPATRPADNQRDAAFNRTRSDPASLEENTHLTPALKSPSVTSSGHSAGRWSGCCSPLLLQHQVLSMRAQSKTLCSAPACWWDEQPAPCCCIDLREADLVPAPQPGHLSTPNAPEASLTLGFVDGEKDALRRWWRFHAIAAAGFRTSFKKHAVSKETFIPFFLFSNFLVQSLFSEVPTWSFLLPASVGIFLSISDLFSLSVETKAVIATESNNGNITNILQQHPFISLPQKNNKNKSKDKIRTASKA